MIYHATTAVPKPTPPSAPGKKIPALPNSLFVHATQTKDIILEDISSICVFETNIEPIVFLKQFEESIHNLQDDTAIVHIGGHAGHMFIAPNPEAVDRSL